MPVVCTLLLELLSEEPYKLIHDLMSKTIHSIAVFDFPDKWTELQPALLIQISLNSDPGRDLSVHNAQLVQRKVCKKY